MDSALKKQLQYLGLSHLAENWEAIHKEATQTSPAYHRFLSRIVEWEYERKTEKARLASLKRARIPEVTTVKPSS